MTRIWVIAGYLAATALLATGLWWAAYVAGLDRLQARGQADLALASGRLQSKMQEYGALAVLMADHPVVRDLATGRGDVAGDLADTLLRRTADLTGAQDLRLIAPTGWTLATSSADRSAPPRPLLARALAGMLGRYHGVEPGTGRRRYTFAAPVFDAAAPGAQGALLVDVDVDALEDVWRGAPQAVWITDAAGLIFFTNRTELVLQNSGAGGLSGEGLDVSRYSLRGHDLWRVHDHRYLPRHALHLTQPLPVLGLMAELLVDTDTARRAAWLQALVATALLLVIGAGLLLTSDRRRALRDRLTLESAVNARLERDVAERTRALRDANAVLRREVAERLEAEAALTRAQADLLQASKLSALGQMSAGISHELNQPLMAIRSFAENGAAFIERGNPEVAAQNLGRIAEMARRMGRIIKNLRAFARQDPTHISDVDLTRVVTDVLDMLEERAARTGVRIIGNTPDAPVIVRGGEVRLQQVLLNLVTNALDAVEGQGDARVTLTLSDGDPVTLAVRDTGPGIDAPDRIFDPFYSTKEVGASEGMGLGLSISYGLVQSFGGSISGRNHPDGGAEFEVRLQSAAARIAA